MKSHLQTFFTLLYTIKSIIIRFSKHHISEKCVPFSHAHWLGRMCLASTIHLREAEKTKSRVKSLIPDHFLVNWHKNRSFWFFVDCTKFIIHPSIGENGWILASLVKNPPLITSTLVNSCELTGNEQIRANYCNLFLGAELSFICKMALMTSALPTEHIVVFHVRCACLLYYQIVIT